MWFVNSQTGALPDPFTTMRYENDKIIGGTFNPDGSITDIGEFRTVRQGLMKWTTDYLKSLATGGRYPHMIWPYHCLIGTPGYNIVAPLFNVILDWETSNVAQATLLTKGSNFKTEHFSAVRAEVTDPEDQMTQLNTDFIGLFSEADEILLAGEARSHCLANTVRDMAEYFTDDSFIKKCVLLIDATSDVGGLEHLGKQFVSDMKAKGMQVTTTVDYLA
jgi:nicotinamidase/pyrazinamidase